MKLWAAWLRACGSTGRPWPSWYWARTLPARLNMRLFCWKCGRLKYSWRLIYCPLCAHRLYTDRTIHGE
jgi:hypothetical protein